MGLDMAVSCTAMFMPSENLGLHVVSMSHGDGDDHDYDHHHDDDDYISYNIYIIVMFVYCDGCLRSSRINFTFPVVDN